MDARDDAAIRACYKGDLYHLVDFRVYTLREGERVDPCAEHRSCATVVTVAGGCGSLHLPDQRLELRNGSVVMLPVYYSAPIQALQAPLPLLIYALSLQAYRLTERTDATLLYQLAPSSDPREEATVCVSARLVALMQELARLYKADRAECREALEALLRDVMQERAAMESEQARRSGEGYSPAGKIAYAQMWIKANYGSRITRGGLAEKLGLNPEYFSSLFHKETGQRFSDYLARVRIEQARQLLLVSRRRGLDEIAQAVGYADGLYLSRKFKQTFGVSPSAYMDKPKRIVALEYAGQLLALGLRPVGTVRRYLRKWTLFRNELAGVADVGEFPEPELVEALAPDVILAHDSLSESVIDRMREIAPTVVIPFNGMYPFEQLNLFADMFDRKTQAQQFLARYHAKASALRQRLEPVIGSGRTAIQYEIWNERLWIVEDSDGRGAYNLYQSLGLRFPDRLRTKAMREQAALGLLPDQLAEYEADHLFVSVHEDYPEPGSRQQEWAAKLFAGKQWGELPAVRNNRVHYLDFRLFPPCGDAFSLYCQLDIQARSLSGRELLTKSNNNP